MEASAEYVSDQVLADYDSSTPLTIDEFEDNAVLIDDFEGIGTQEQDFYTADSPLTEVEMEEGDFFYSKDESEFDSHDLAADFHGIEQSSLEVHDSEFDESDSAESSYSALMQSLNPDYASSSFGVNPELEPVQTIDISTEINQIFSEISTEDTVVRDITNTIENMDVRQTKHVVVTLQKLEGLSKTYESAEANETDVNLLPILERLSDQLDIDIAVLMQLLGISDTNERLSPQAIETIKRLQRLMQEQLQAELTQASNTSSTTSETTIKRLARYAVKLIKGPLHQQETLTA